MGPLLPWAPGLTPDQVFNMASIGLPAWALMIAAPQWRWTPPVVLALAGVLGAVYTALYVQLILDYGGYAKLSGHFFTLEGVMEVMPGPLGTLTAWLHFLVTDVLSMLWVVRDAGERGVPAALVRCHVALSLVIPTPATLLPYLLVVRPLLGRRHLPPAQAAMSSADHKQD